MSPRALQPIGIARLSLSVLLLVCLAIRPVLLAVAPFHELEHLASGAAPAQVPFHVDRVADDREHMPTHGPELHRLMQRHAVIVAAEVPSPVSICATGNRGAIRFACVAFQLPVGRYAVPLRPPIA